MGSARRLYCNPRFCKRFALTARQYVIVSRLPFLVLIASLLPLVVSPAQAQEARETHDVLFVGNSYIYFNNLHELVAAFSTELDGPLLRTHAHTHGGYTLRRHLEDGHVADLLAAGPADGSWETVILQEQSSLGGRGRSGKLGDPADFLDAVSELDALIGAANAETMLYMTWAKERLPDQIAGLRDAYDQAGKAVDGSVAPVGLAWARVRSERPDVALFISDGSHPSAAGSYLAACVFYSQITGRSSAGAPATIFGSPWGSENTRTRLLAAARPDGLVELVSLDPDLARYLQDVAWDVVSGRKSR